MPSMSAKCSLDLYLFQHRGKNRWAEGYGPKKGSWENQALQIDKSIVRNADKMTEFLNSWGPYGWELVTIVRGGWRDCFDTVYLRREGKA